MPHRPLGYRAADDEKQCDAVQNLKGDAVDALRQGRWPSGERCGGLHKIKTYHRHYGEEREELPPRLALPMREHERRDHGIREYGE